MIQAYNLYIYDPRALYHILIKVKGILNFQVMKQLTVVQDQYVYEENDGFIQYAWILDLFRTKPLAEEIALSLDLGSSQRLVIKKVSNTFEIFTD